MGNKKTAKKWIMQNQAVAGSTVTTAALDVQGMDMIGLQFVWTGTPSGTLNVNVSVDSAFPEAGTKTFTSLTLSPSNPGPAGSAGSYYVNLATGGFPFMNLSYVPAGSPGSGTLNIFYYGKDSN